MTAPLLACVLAALLGMSLAVPGLALACTQDADCGCDGTMVCEAGACVPAFTLPVFPLGIAGASPYATDIIAVLDHAGGFYTGCCDTQITAFTGEHAERDADAVLCSAPPEFPACLFGGCLCGYASADGAPFVVNGSYVGVVGPSHLQYDGHAGYDYVAFAGTPLVATRDGALCKAVGDPVNGTGGQPTAWDGFHTFYVDHGSVAGFGWSSWYLHATDLAGTALDGRSLASLAAGECAPVAAGQLIATAGNVGTMVPHLHFEVRRHDPADGPEGATAKVVDPYGWRGAGADPWSQPGGNPQAASRGPAVWRGCGNGRVECGEVCDGGPCCTTACTWAVATSCRLPLAPGGSTLALRAAKGAAAGSLSWQWRRGAATIAADFGDPRGGDGYRLCAFSADGSLVFGAAIPAGDTCPEAATTPCWKGNGNPAGSRGFRYRDRAGTPDGIESLRLQPGVAGAAKITLKARGLHLALPSLPLTVPLRVQLSSDTGACWEARFAADGVQRSDASRFTGQSE